MKRLALLALFAASPAVADVYVTPKHLMILYPGLDAVYGTYVFAVQNDGKEPAHLKTAVMLPKETTDFVPQEGVEPDEVTLAEGGVTVEKTFPEGTHIISLRFKTDARYGKSDLTLVPPAEIQSFTLLVPRQSDLRVESALLSPGGDSEAPDPQYKPYVTGSTLPSGTAFTVAVSGLPEGRTRLWIVGAVIAGLMVLLAGFLALRTRPKIREDDAGGAILVN